MNAPRLKDESVTSARRAAMLKTAFGPIVGAALEDPSVIEVMVNADGGIWLDRQQLGRVATESVIRPAEVERIIRLVASNVGAECGKHNPIVSAELPETGERFEGILPPVTAAPVFAIRKPAQRIFDLNQYVDDRIMTGAQALVIKKAVAERENILIAGGSSSGKTTLANAILAEIRTTEERLLILEDTRELRCAASDFVALRTSATVDLAQLVRSTLRLRPDRIIVGEVRGGEALDLLKAWNTGHPGGLATVHANSALSALSRLEQLIGERTAQPLHQLVADAIDLVVFIRKTPSARRVEEIIRVIGVDPDGVYRTTPTESHTLSLVHEGPTS